MERGISIKFQRSVKERSLQKVGKNICNFEISIWYLDYNGKGDIDGLSRVVKRKVRVTKTV